MVWIVKENKKIPPIPTINVNRRVADNVPSNKGWINIHDIADSHEKEMVEVFLNATNKTREGVNKSRFKRAYLDMDQNGMIDSIPIDDVFKVELNKGENAIRLVFEEIGKAMILYLPSTFRGFEFTITDRARNWLQESTASLVTNITEETRGMIRDEVKQAFINGYGVDTTADSLINIIGLTKKQGRAVIKYRDMLIEEGFNLLETHDRVVEYSKRLLRFRAENIARTELMNAANEGHLEMLLQAIDSGVINDNDVMREWIVTPDDRLCVHCAPMDGVRVGVFEDFDTTLGMVRRPPLHPRCRCTTANVFIR